MENQLRLANSNRKQILWIIPILLFILLAARTKTIENHIITIGITQIVEHPSLDQEREGIMSALKEAGYIEGQNLKVIYQNAQGSTVTSTQIAQKLVSLQPNVIVAISTPSAQSALAAIGIRKIPLVFTAVTDPLGARLVKTLSHPGIGVTGVSDYMSPDPQFALIQRLIPHLKTLGIIYNPGESNSSSLYKDLQTAAPLYKIQLVTATATRTSEVVAAAQSLVGRVDAIYVPNDNTAASAIKSIIHVGISNRLPVFAGDTGSISQGAVGGAVYNRSELGKAAGKQIVQILRQGSPQEIRVESLPPVEITLNRIAASKMGVQLPNDLLPANVHWIGDSK